MSRRIDLRRAAIWGAIVAPLLLIVRATLTGRWPREDLAFQLGYVCGAIAGGALLFVAAAAIINALRR